MFISFKYICNNSFTAFQQIVSSQVERKVQIVYVTTFFFLLCTSYFFFSLLVLMMNRTSRNIPPFVLLTTVECQLIIQALKKDTVPIFASKRC